MIHRVIVKPERLRRRKMEQLRVPDVIDLTSHAADNWRFKQQFDLVMEASRAVKKIDKRKVALLLNLAGLRAGDLFNAFSLTVGGGIQM